MKKLLSVIMSAIIILEISIISLAAEAEIPTQASQEQDGKINVDYNMEVSYTVIFPASVTFTDTEKNVERSLLVTDVFLNEGSSLYVNVASLNEFKMKNGEGSIDYYIQVNTHIPQEKNNYNVLIVDAGERAGWAVINFVTELKKDDALYAGKYTDTLTFTVTVE